MEVLDVPDFRTMSSAENSTSDYTSNLDFGVTRSTSSTFPENITEKPLPIDMKFNDGHRLAIFLYSLLMIVSAIGNLTVFSAIVRLSRKGKLSRINVLLLNLTIADLIVTFIMMPLEIAWSRTVSWQAGDTMCRIMSFWRILGLYLTGNIHVCIALDRYFAVMRATRVPNDGRNRIIIMLVAAWLLSIVCSFPQSYIFHVEKHPEFRWYEQCVTFNSFPSPRIELTYNLVSFFFLYALPLIMIIFCYACVLCKMYRSNPTTKNDEGRARSNIGALGRAKSRTLKMSLAIVITFVFCWSPYNVMSIWYWIDKESAQLVDQRVQKGLFLFACTNSCVNPIIYGVFHFRSARSCWGVMRFFTKTQPDSGR